MKKIASLAMLLAFAIGVFAAVPASADPHKQNFQKRCPPNATTCK